LIFGELEELNDLRPPNRRKCFQEGFNGLATFQVIDQHLNRDTRAGEARSAMHDLGIDRNYSVQARTLLVRHNSKVRYKQD